MEKVRCKMVVVKSNEDEVKLEPVYDEDPESENGKFYAATPGGFIQLEIINQKTVDHFEEGKEYYVDFTKAK